MLQLNDTYCIKMYKHFSLILYNIRHFVTRTGGYDE